jgi:hypothetical protein
MLRNQLISIMSVPYLAVAPSCGFLTNYFKILLSFWAKFFSVSSSVQRFLMEKSLGTYIERSSRLDVSTCNNVHCVHHDLYVRAGGECEGVGHSGPEQASRQVSSAGLPDENTS